MNTITDNTATTAHCSRCKRPVCKCFVWGFAKSEVSPSAFTHTVTELHTWCGVQVRRIRKTFHNDLSSITAQLRAYRHDKAQYLALDFWGEQGQHDDVTFCIWGENTYADTSENHIEIIDMVEAMHAASIILQALVMFGLPAMEIGNTQNETNQAVVNTPFTGTQTNGQMCLWQQEESSKNQKEKN